jgi:probable rRNA maturation factor
MPDLLLDFQTPLASWRRVPRLFARLQTAAQAVARHVSVASDFSATVLLAGNARVRQLNHDFRGIDKATNVLSFPQFSPKEMRRFKRQKEKVFLGDIVLAYQYVVAEAKKDDKILINHATHLVVHGLLHLFGYDHQKEAEATRMEKMEIRIMKDLGLPDPYAPQPRKRKNRKA